MISNKQFRIASLVANGSDVINKAIGIDINRRGSFHFFLSQQSTQISYNSYSTHSPFHFDEKPQTSPSSFCALIAFIMASTRAAASSSAAMADSLFFSTAASRDAP